MGIKNLDTVFVQQAIITGQISDAITGETVVVSSITLAWRISEAVNYKSYLKPARLKPGANFVFQGAPENFFPELKAEQSLECRLTVQADGYQENTVDFTLSAAQVTPTKSTEIFGDFEVKLNKLAVPVREENIILQPNPVSLAGRVIEDNDFESPVANASVSIITSPSSGSVKTDETGYFRIDDLPVVEKVTVNITASNGESLTKEVLLNYQQRVNERTFSLSA